MVPAHCTSGAGTVYTRVCIVSLLYMNIALQVQVHCIHLYALYLYCIVLPVMEYVYFTRPYVQ